MLLLLALLIFTPFQTFGLLLPADLNFMPSLANGHLGYTVFCDAIYMNGVYNGQAGESRRARIPNFLNFSISVEHKCGKELCHETLPIQEQFYNLNTQGGYFEWQQAVPEVGLTLEQRTYPHRYYNRAIIYELLVRRTENSTKEPLILTLNRQAGNPSDAFDFTHSRVNVGNFSAVGDQLEMLKGVTRVVENSEFQKERKTIFIIFSDDFEQSKVLNLSSTQQNYYYRFIMTADEEERVACKEMFDILSKQPLELFEQHVKEWNKFWTDFNIKVEGNEELSEIISTGIFYLANSLPSPNTNQQKHPFYGLSPTGLGRGQFDSDYEGHNFWDTEIWMLPVVTQFNVEWGRELLKYRLEHLKGAQYNANITGMKGARFPWESAYTGTEVTNPCCPEVADQEIHISPDIVFAMQQHYFTIGQNDTWLCTEAWSVVGEVAKFLESRVVYNTTNQKYHIKDVMGPDEDHLHVDDNVFTNVVFKIALHFASFTQSKCSQYKLPNKNWQRIADNIQILYDAELDYHPQHLGYHVGDQIKQADVILLGYPLQFPMNTSSRLQDLKIYENVTRSTGPAMTWSMFTINYLDINDTEKADYYFIKGYKDYVSPQFKVWSETKNLNGSANFITGVGGFLQAIINGYAGIRIQHEHYTSFMEIKPPRLLPSTKSVTINGIKYGQAQFSLQINGKSANLTCLQLGNVDLVLYKGAMRYELFKGFTNELIADETVIIKTA